jgi:hypothetical protein
LRAESGFDSAISPLVPLDDAGEGRVLSFWFSRQSFPQRPDNVARRRQFKLASLFGQVLFDDEKHRPHYDRDVVMPMIAIPVPDVAGAFESVLGPAAGSAMDRWRCGHAAGINPVTC